MTIYRIYGFEAAHRLPFVPADHKCARLHGHSFKFEVHVRGPVGAASGWVRDFGDLDRLVAPLLEQLDHHYLNDVEGLDNPTSENIARWLWARLGGLHGLCRVVVRETCRGGCIYEGGA